jgi:prepilin-type N-terminal cleavage/methylation domain-containing protein
MWHNLEGLARRTRHAGTATGRAAGRAAAFRGVTLVELLVALSVVTMLSAAIAVLLAGAGNTHQYVNNEADAMSNVENAFRRIMHNVRTASAMTAPGSSTLTNTLTVQTQSDPNYGGVPATVTYLLSNGNLVETDSRYAGSSILVPGVSAFTVQRTGTSPVQLNISITSGTTPAVTRTAMVTCRNL